MYCLNALEVKFCGDLPGMTIDGVTSNHLVHRASTEEGTVLSKYLEAGIAQFECTVSLTTCRDHAKSYGRHFPVFSWSILLMCVIIFEVSTTVVPLQLL